MRSPCSSAVASTSVETSTSSGRNDSPSRGSTSSTPRRKPRPRTSRTMSRSPTRRDELVAEARAAAADSFDEAFGLQRLEDGQPDGAELRSAVPCMAVLELAGAGATAS